jgi:hypothetical protein
MLCSIAASAQLFIHCQQRQFLNQWVAVQGTSIIYNRPASEALVAGHSVR